MSEIVYILTNDCMPGIVKIGRTTNNVEKRMKELYKTGVPIPFDCHYAGVVKDANEVEKVLHEAYGDSRINKNREFFRLSPERARAILSYISVEDVTPSDTPVENADDKVAIKKARKIAAAFNFEMVDIPVGAELVFSRDENITATVVDKKNVRFRDTVCSLTSAALTIMREMGYDWDRIQGPKFWKFENEILVDRRSRLEQE